MIDLEGWLVANDALSKSNVKTMAQALERLSEQQLVGLSLLIVKLERTRSSTRLKQHGRIACCDHAQVAPLEAVKSQEVGG